MTAQSSTALYKAIRAHVRDSRTAALVTESVLIPVAGIGTPVSPPTYAGKEEDPVTGKKIPLFAVSDGVPVPQANNDGWYQDLESDPNESGIRRAAQVIIDSVGSQSGRAETALLASDALGTPAPGIFVKGTRIEGDSEEVEDVSSLNAQTADALSHEISTWTAAHREADAWIKFAQTPDKKQVWEEGALNDGRVVKDIIISANPDRGEVLYSFFPNSAIYGYWLSSGTALRHRMPRSYSSQIVGYAAQGIKSAATMLDDTGGASGSSKVEVRQHRLVSGGKKKPSDVGFGPVPGSPRVHAYSCELILQRATISLATLRRIRFQNSDVQEAALTVLVLMAMLGHVLANEDGFLRSGCALAVTETKWGWRLQGNPAGKLEELQVGDVGEVQEALNLAIQAAEKLDLRFEAPIELEFSDAQKSLIKDRVSAQDAKQGSDSDDQ